MTSAEAGTIDYDDGEESDQYEGEDNDPPVEGIGLRLYQAGLVTKRGHIKLWVRTIIKFAIAITVMWVGLVASTTLYYGALWDPDTHDMDVAVANRDRGVLTPSGTIIKFGSIVAQGITTARTEDDDELWLHWKVIEDDEDDENYEGVRDQSYWATVTFPANYSAVLWQTVHIGRHIAYDNPVRVVLNEGRQQTSAMAVKNVLTGLLNGVSNKLGASLLSGAFGPVNVETANPDVFVDPVYPQFDLLYHVENNGANFSSYMSIIITWIQSILGVNIALNTTDPLLSAVGFGRLALFRLLIFLFVSIMITLSVSTIGIIFGLEPDKGFVPLWLFMILVVMTFESIIFFLIRGLGPLGLMLLTVILILQVTTSNALLHTDMMPPFYGVVDQYLPFYHAVEGLRFITFGGKCCFRIGMNILALGVYFIGFSILGFLIWKTKMSRALKDGTKDYLIGAEGVTLPSSIGYGV